MGHLVIARYPDGRTVKGVTLNFQPDAEHCHIAPPERPYDEGVRIALRDLKALFFVRDLRGNPAYRERKDLERPEPYGHLVRVRFKDGEEIVGTAYRIDRRAPGVLLHPVDPQSNNERILAVWSAIERFEEIPAEPSRSSGANEEHPSPPSGG
ncbi:MAG: hypothetical protein KatS3mg102_0014 [Planctomycetota bacterium]|nr:MAG: hypothetical protein KatS3mg102_0014 [Planctomycetota bacterium]